VLATGAAEWKRMSEAQKAPWQKRAKDARAQYAASKPALVVAKIKPKAAKAKRSANKPKPSARVCATKPKSKAFKSKARAAAKPKSKAGKPGKTSRVIVAGTKKHPKTVKKIKVCWIQST